MINKIKVLIDLYAKITLGVLFGWFIIGKPETVALMECMIIVVYVIVNAGSFARTVEMCGLRIRTQSVRVVKQRDWQNWWRYLISEITLTDRLVSCQADREEGLILQGRLFTDLKY